MPVVYDSDIANVLILLLSFFMQTLLDLLDRWSNIQTLRATMKYHECPFKMADTFYMFDVGPVWWDCTNMNM